MDEKPVMKIRGLTKYYGDILGIKDLDLDVYPGEIMGFLGPNGAGKTTTIRTSLGFLRKTAGDVKIFGLDSHKDSVEIKRKVGYLPGDFGMIPDLKVRTFLKYLLSLSKVKSEKKMKELGDKLDLEFDKKIKQLSKGNRQKVGIVQAFMADQDLIILDEPTGGLDPLMQQRFYEILREEKENGKTIFMSSHILAEVEEVCDRVAIIKNGRLQVIEDIDSLQQKMGKKLTVEFREEVDPDMFRMKGVNQIQKDGKKITMVVTDNLDETIKKISSRKIITMNLETFSLEQLFLRYYKEEVEEG
ncbi:MAG: ABC transporter ATP-binding protein [Thermoplasmatota archaeon]